MQFLVAVVALCATAVLVRTWQDNGPWSDAMAAWVQVFDCFARSQVIRQRNLTMPAMPFVTHESQCEIEAGTIGDEEPSAN